MAGARLHGGVSRMSLEARRIRVWGIVQGVGFRPFVYRLARQHGLRGWVLNDEGGVEAWLEGRSSDLEAFLAALSTEAPSAAQIAGIRVHAEEPRGYLDFRIAESHKHNRPITRIPPDLAVCEDCLRELFAPTDRRYRYPYINCTNCGPRYSVILGLPYDRPNTTVRSWAMCPACEREYHDPLDRRFHAQPTACPVCGPHYFLKLGDAELREEVDAIREAARLLQEGKIVAIKGLGGYHLACNAEDPRAVQALRERKFRKEKPFALMVPDLQTARALVEIAPETEALLTSCARPIVLAPARRHLPGVAPENRDLGVMLPYTPLHYLLFAEGAPSLLIFTSANRSSEPIAYHDDEALEKLSDIADAFLMGERPIARRLDDSVVRQGPFGPLMLRRSRGYAPAAVATLPIREPILAVGADLKNTVTLVVEGQVFMSQFVGDLEHYEAFRAHQETLQDLLRMYELDPQQLTVVRDLHPEYRSSQHALSLPAKRHLTVQHHKAHLASVLAERGAYDKRVLGVVFDGTGYGDDGAIWGGEFFIGSLVEGFKRVGHLLPALLPGGDAAARFPVQAAAGFLYTLDDLPDLTLHPFEFPPRYLQARELLRAGIRSFRTTSAGRLFDTVAALLGYTRAITFEGQAAIWLEQLARATSPVEPYALPFDEGVLDFRGLLRSVIGDRQQGRNVGEIARAFHAGLAEGIYAAVRELTPHYPVAAVVLSGGVFQNKLLLDELYARLTPAFPQIWLNRVVPPNDGGISLGQAATAALSSGAAFLS